MSPVSNGRWDIESIVINAETVLNNEGFNQLTISNSKIEIRPADLNFAIESVDGSTMTLLSRGQLFFAKCSTDGEFLEMLLTRPRFTETIKISARLNKPSNTLEREVVQV